MSQDETSRNMGFLGHLDELRVRVVRALYVFVAGFLGCYFLITEWVMSFLRAPIFKVLPEGQQKLYFTNLFENFLTHLKVSAVAAIFLLSPYLFYELWAFISPGLYEKERKLAIPFIFLATLFFLMGGAFAYFVLFPAAFQFFIFFGAPSDVPLLTIDAYYTTCMKLILLFGAAFEFPVLIGLLGYLGIVDAKFLRKNRRNGVLAITVFAAMFAPPDAISMMILMAPLYLMYEILIVVLERFISGRKGE